MGGTDELFYTAPSSFVAEAHANWSIAGVVICSFLVLLALRILDYFILTVKNPLIYGALVSYSALHFSALSIKGFTTFVVDYYFWGVLIFALFAYKMRVYRKDGIYV